MPFRAAISAQPYACMCSRPFPTCHPNQAPQLAPVFFTAIISNPLTKSLSPRRSERAARAARRRSTLTNFAHRRCSNTTIPTHWQHPGEIFPPECLAGSARVIATTIFSPFCTPTFLQVAHAARRQAFSKPCTTQARLQLLSARTESGFYDAEVSTRRAIPVSHLRDWYDLPHPDTRHAVFPPSVDPSTRPFT
ncbi:hypothetical protein BV25DRAFT_1030009 [Artomyces pyxidatus]|uniref:Uncharacterized protein n=1 Tax=Artomyces pyxidatus TaxID=48021 RepID=A0ACB8SUJ3_9AGAM|nr:hypothetical protein BV25DRAFT_1030009 [Artomyces pyxidatus]